MSNPLNPPPMGPLYGLLSLLRDLLEEGADRAPEGRTAWLEQQMATAVRHSMPNLLLDPKLEQENPNARDQVDEIQKVHLAEYRRALAQWFESRVGLPAPSSGGERPN